MPLICDFYSIKLLVAREWGRSHHRSHSDQQLFFLPYVQVVNFYYTLHCKCTHLSHICLLCVQHCTFSLKMGFPESSVRCMNSKWSVPNSARMLLPADAHPQFQLVPLEQKAKHECEYHHPRCVPQQPETMATSPLYEQVQSNVDGWSHGNKIQRVVNTQCGKMAT